MNGIDQKASNGNFAMLHAKRPPAPEGILRVIGRRRTIVAVMTGIALAGAFAYLRLAPSKYVASAQLYVDHAGNRLIAGATSQGIGDEYLATQCSVLTSNRILSSVLKRPQIRGLDIFLGNNDAIAVLQSRLTAEPVRKEEVVKVSFDAPNAQDAATVTNAVVEEFCRAQDQQVMVSSGGTLQALEKSRDEQDADRLSRQTTLLNFRRSNPDISLSTGKGSNVIVDRLAALSDARTAAEIDVSHAQAACVGNDTTINQLRLRAALAREDDVNARYVQQTAAAIALNATQTEYEKLQAESKRSENLWEAADQRLKQFRVSEQMPVDRLSVLESAQPPVAAVWPDPLRVIALATLIGVALGVVVALVVDHTDGCLRYVEDVAQNLGLPIVGTVPLIRMFSGAPLWLGGRGNRGRQVETDPHCPAAEAVRDVRTHVSIDRAATDGGILLITSPTPRDGKSMLASNLAISLANSGKRVLLIDADLRRPVQHEVFGLNSEMGLADVLSKNAGLKDVIYATSTPGLWLLPAGILPPNPSELLEDSRFAKLLAKVGCSFDHVLIDSPPVGSATDARVIAGRCDRTILVVRAGWSLRKSSEEARDKLASVGAKILGVVVNGVRQEDGRLGQYGYGDYAPPKRKFKAPAAVRVVTPGTRSSG